ncbi:MAG: class I SAM-dependent methyltransferase [Stackebrandtia sp.]
MPNVREFYDALAADYHRIFRDWDAAIDWQATILSDFIDGGPKAVLDCACGIGTQAIGLARAGHRVTGTDLSPVAAARAHAEAARRDLTIPTAAADMRRLPFGDNAFGAVLCADNSIAHLLTPDDVRTAFRQMRRVLTADGRLVLTMRGDYEQVRRERRPSTPPQVSHTETDRTVTFQLWHWHDDGEHYDFDHVQLHDVDGERRVSVRAATSWAMSLDQVAGFARDAGFGEVEWHEPAATGYYQHILSAR